MYKVFRSVMLAHGGGWLFAKLHGYGPPD